VQKHPITKYRPFPAVDLPGRQWPDRQLTQPPLWVSVDLRDGNQALAIPMSVEDKLELFAALVDIGFKEIEVGFPSASQIEFDFIRRLIDENRIPEDVTVQVLVQCRKDLIERTFESLRGVQRAIVHIYNSTNPAQRKIVFGLGREEIKAIAVGGALLVKDLVPTVPGTEIVLQYSPETFVLTELDFVLEVCEAVSDVWQPTPERKIILNLPTTVECSTPNIHADQIEWMGRHLTRRDCTIISLHPHNDRGTGVASAELAMLAGADRVEGTLFGNGERTGNVDIVTLALNLYTQGVDPGLNLSNLPAVREVYERTTRMDVHPRHPYGGDLVFTAFSGSHQDAINKGFKYQAAKEADLTLPPSEREFWEVPYLPIDPRDIGRTYDAIIRINSQSGKGGVAYVMEQDHGFQMPKEMHREFGPIVNALADKVGRELTSDEILNVFREEFLDRESPVRLRKFEAWSEPGGTGAYLCSGSLEKHGAMIDFQGKGNGPVDAFVNALRDARMGDLEILSFSEHSLGKGANAQAASYIRARVGNGRPVFGCGVDTNIERATIKAVICAFNRSRQH
jgi:2-isopropylmalate synthase